MEVHDVGTDVQVTFTQDEYKNLLEVLFGHTHMGSVGITEGGLKHSGMDYGLGCFYLSLVSQLDRGDRIVCSVYDPPREGV